MEPLLRKVAMRFGNPLTSGRGFASIPPRHEMAERYRSSGNEKLVLLVMSDFDPAGQENVHSLARSMRDDFGISSIHPVKAGLTFEQVQGMNLQSSSNCTPTARGTGKNPRSGMLK